MFGRGGKNMEKKKGEFKKEKGSGLFLEKKRNSGRIWNTLTIWVCPNNMQTEAFFEQRTEHH